MSISAILIFLQRKRNVESTRSPCTIDRVSNRRIRVGLDAASSHLAVAVRALRLPDEARSRSPRGIPNQPQARLRFSAPPRESDDLRRDPCGWWCCARHGRGSPIVSADARSHSVRHARFSYLDPDSRRAPGCRSCTPKACAASAFGVRPGTSGGAGRDLPDPQSFPVSRSRQRIETPVESRARCDLRYRCFRAPRSAPAGGLQPPTSGRPAAGLISPARTVMGPAPPARPLDRRMRANDEPTRVPYRLHQ